MKSKIKQQGFSILELFMVMTFMDVLATNIMPNYSNFHEKASFIKAQEVEGQSIKHLQASL